MKKHIISMAVLSAFALPAFAQSSVTLYGIIDEGFDFTNNVGGHHAYDMLSGAAQGNRWGLKGDEDLGGGMKAVFQLENGFTLNNGALGQGGLMFGRQAYVGLSSNQFGTLTVGRQYDSLVDFLAPTTANGSWGGSLLSHPFDNDNTDNSFRVNNTIKYTSVNYAGLQFGGTYSFSNSTNFADNRQYSVGAQYANGGLLVAAAYLQANNPGSATNPSGTIPGVCSSSSQANFCSSLLRIYGVGANYSFGPATVGLVYTNTYLKNPTGTTYLAGSTLNPTTGNLAGGTLTSLRYQNIEVNGKYAFTPAFYVGAQYVFTMENYDTTAGNVKPKIHSVGLMADYSLSKRTDVYLQGVYQQVAGSATGSLLDFAYIPGSAGASSTSRQGLIRLAMRHIF